MTCPTVTPRVLVVRPDIDVNQTINDINKSTAFARLQLWPPMWVSGAASTLHSQVDHVISHLSKDGNKRINLTFRMRCIVACAAPARHPTAWGAHNDYGLC